MKYDEVCPKCGSEDYEDFDYGDYLDGSGGEQWWTCKCKKCGCTFNITIVYELKNVIIKEVSAS